MGYTTVPISDYREKQMTKVQELAEYIVRTKYNDLSEFATTQLKIRVLDSLGCAIGAMRGEPVSMIRKQISTFERSGRCTLIGGGSASPDRAAFYNSTLVRYLDFNDSYLAEGETCHPSDNLGAVLAASEYSGISGKDFLVALAVAYQVQCRLSDVAPVRSKGFDHTTQGSYAVAAGVSRALGLNSEATANALAICGTAFNALRVTRTGELSHWKGLAYPNTVFGCTHATFLARQGITGPSEVFEGNKGFIESISGRFKIDWSKEDLEKVRQTAIKKYNAEFHSQSTIEGILELQSEYNLYVEEIEKIEIDIFDVAYNIIGGGEEGNKKVVRRKEEADHSLPYMVSVALLDRILTPQQYAQERITKSDVQSLLQRVFIRPARRMNRRFPAAMPCRITVALKNGKKLVNEKSDYEGFPTTPMSWNTVISKFNTLTAPFVKKNQRENIIKAVKNLDSIDIRVLLELLGSFKNNNVES
jgi:2-methylcitrate dehydratase